MWPNSNLGSLQTGTIPPMSETPKYYITRGHNKSGPFTNSDLRRKAATGSLLPTDLIFKDGMSEWVKAKRVKGLFPAEEQKPILEPSFVEDFEPESSESEYNVNNSHEFEETAKRSFVSKIKTFILGAVVLCVFLFFLITMSLSIVTTKEQRVEFAKKVEQQRIEREKRRIEEAKIEAEKELIAKKQAEIAKKEAEEKAARNPDSVDPRSITKDEWKAIFEKAIKVDTLPFYNDYKLTKIFGKPSSTQTIGGRSYIYYECSDGTIQLKRLIPIPPKSSILQRANSTDINDKFFSYELNDF